MKVKGLTVAKLYDIEIEKNIQKPVSSSLSDPTEM